MANLLISVIDSCQLLSNLLTNLHIYHQLLTTDQITESTFPTRLYLQHRHHETDVTAVIDHHHFIDNREQLIALIQQYQSEGFTFLSKYQTNRLLQLYRHRLTIFTTHLDQVSNTITDQLQSVWNHNHLLFLWKLHNIDKYTEIEPDLRKWYVLSKHVTENTETDLIMI